MGDHQPPEPPAGIVTAENAARRVIWTLGRPLRLADGAAWWLPHFESALPLFRPELSAALARSFCLAEEVARAESDPDRHTLATAIHHAQLAQVAVMLLQVNYDLPDPTWRRLLIFERLGELLRLTLAVAEEIADSVPVWMPFVLTDSPDGSGASPGGFTAGSAPADRSGGRP